MTIARRLHRLLKPKDSLSRFAGDQFALMLLSEQDSARIAAVADAIKHAINNPITFAKREIVLTASIGLITWTTAQTSAEDMVKDAELAMHQAKRFGGDRIEPFRPAFRTVGTDRLQFESDLRAPSSGANSRSPTSRSCAWRTAASPASRRCSGGTIRAAA
ncbi:hypothetical protein AJ88_09275 [Mesorhizobium amorphae CCBAU 01583]|nr:hypothetical protein AJ88_09275 [Mesorhizobium amorphae CCBAU 01583]